MSVHTIRKRIQRTNIGPVVSWLQTVIGKPAYMQNTKPANPAVVAGYYLCEGKQQEESKGYIGIRRRGDGSIMDTL
jgi:hypothetical protein